MKNSDPRLAEIRLKNLESGRGKRPKLDHQFVGMRLSPQSRERLEEIAALYGCTYGSRPWLSGLLTKIANGELLIVPCPPYPVNPPSTPTEEESA